MYFPIWQIVAIICLYFISNVGIIWLVDDEDNVAIASLLLMNVIAIMITFGITIGLLM